MQHISRRRKLIAGAVAGAAALAGFGYLAAWEGAPHLAGMGAGMGTRDTVAGVPYSFAAIPLCLDGSGSITIESVTPARTEGGIAVQGFAVRRMQSNVLGAQRGTLTALGFRSASTRRVDRACSDSDTAAPDELGVQLVRTGNESGAVHGLTVEYRSWGLSHTVTFSLDLSLCARGDRLSADCRDS